MRFINALIEHIQLPILMELRKMSQSMHDQLSAIEAKLSSQLSDLGAAISTETSNVEALKGQLANATGSLNVGDTIQQSDIDALNAVSTGLDSAITNLKTVPSALTQAASTVTASAPQATTPSVSSGATTVSGATGSDTVSGATSEQPQG